MCVNISNVLYEHGHEVYLCATRAGGQLEKAVSPGVRLYILQKRHFADLAAFRRFIYLIKANGIEILHAHSSSLIWAIAAKIFNKKLKVLWHDHLGLRVNDRVKNPAYILVSGMIDGIIAVNHELAEWSRNNMKVPAERIVMINNFPLLNISHRQPDPGFFTIVCLANLRPQKDQETLVRAVAILVRQDLPKKLKVILAGSDDDIEYSGRIRNLINDLNLNDVIEMPGSVEDTASLLARADCGVLSSVSEGLPVALLEYGMATLPVVITDVGQCGEVVGYGMYGKVVAPGDSGALSDSLFWIIENYQDAFDMGKIFKDHIINNFGPGKFIKDYSRLLNIITRG